jgi:hypothetical protein
MTAPSMTLLANGNVGIGTATPGYKLDVNGDTFTKRLYCGNGTNSSDQGVIINTGWKNAEIPTESAPLKVSVRGESVLQVNTNGNVGIGTSSPAYKLDITNGTTRITKMLPVSTFDNSTLDSQLILKSVNSSNEGDVRLYIGSYITGGQYAAGMIQASDYYGTPSIDNPTRLLLNPKGGNVGIGTTDPAQKLGVSGSCHISGQCIIGATDNTLNYALKVTNGGSLIDGGLLINNSSTVNGGLTVNCNGNVGTFSVTNVSPNDTFASNSLTQNNMSLPYSVTDNGYFYLYGRSANGTKRVISIAANTLFTGQHCNIPADPILKTNIRQYEGMIVSSTGSYSSLNNQTKSLITGKDAIKITESLPIVKLTDKDMDKSVWGVITNVKNENYNSDGGLRYDDDTDWVQGLENRIRINGLGEGSIWVININGAIENGDYICSSSIPGYGRKQDDDILHNYTVAKITMDCAFDLTTDKYVCEEITHNGTTYIRAFVGCTYHCS